jgi:hypothetical protein
MAEETYRPDYSINKTPESDENSPKSKKEEKLIKVKKEDKSGKYYEKPFDEQMYTSFEEIRKNKKIRPDDK